MRSISLYHLIISTYTYVLPDPTKHRVGIRRLKNVGMGMESKVSFKESSLKDTHTHPHTSR